jgi:outer membrane protein W
MVVGAKFGYRLTNRLTFELEGGVTFTESTGGDSGNVIQTLLNARYDVYSFNTGVGQLTPYVTAGAGGVFFRGMGNNDEAFAFQGGIGATLNLSNSFGIRVDGRVLQFSDALNAGATTNFQATGGLVFRF